MTVPTPPQAPQAAPTSPAVPITHARPPIEPGPQAEITPAQAATMAEWTKADLLAGKITPEQATQQFNALNTPLDQRVADSRSDEEKMLDKQFPGAKPEAYIIRYGEPGQEPTMTPELKAFDQSARTWMSGAGFPRDVGNSLVNAIAKTAQLTKDMNADQLEQYGADEFAKLERAHGSALDDKLRAAGRMVEDLERKQPGLKQLLKSKGIGDSAMVANLLIAHAQIYHARRGLRGRDDHAPGPPGASRAGDPAVVCGARA